MFMKGVILTRRKNRQPFWTRVNELVSWPNCSCSTFSLWVPESNKTLIWWNSQQQQQLPAQLNKKCFWRQVQEKIVLCESFLLRILVYFRWDQVPKYLKQSTLSETTLYYSHWIKTTRLYCFYLHFLYAFLGTLCAFLFAFFIVFICIFFPSLMMTLIENCWHSSLNSKFRW